VDGQRHRGAAGDVPRRAPVPAADAVHGADPAGEHGAALVGGLPPGPPRTTGVGRHGAVRALPRRQPPPDPGLRRLSSPRAHFYF
jgi:hypothetical protein